MIRSLPRPLPSLLLTTAVMWSGCAARSTASPDVASAPETAAEAPAPAEDPAADVQADPLASAIAGDHRKPENRARDPHRHPAETLAFFGLEPGMTVVEMSPSGGWYTEVLAPVLREEGRLIGAIADPAESKYSQRFLARLEEHPSVFDKVETVVFEPPAHPDLGPEGSADMVLTFRSVHGWVNREQAQDVFDAMARVLKPGGVLGVVQHRAPEGADPVASAKTGYVPEATVIQLATDAGLELDAQSEINANPQDDHDHPEGVWTLPPTLRLGDTDRASWEAIGESDRMTLRFRKPA